MSIKYGESKQQFVKGRRVKNLEIFVDKDTVKVDWDEMSTPEYYNKNGFSPLEAFQKGLLSRDEYVGFLKGNIIKYVVRCEYKDDPIKDLDKIEHYLWELYYVLGSEELDMSLDEFKWKSDYVMRFKLK